MSPLAGPAALLVPSGRRSEPGRDFSAPDAIERSVVASTDPPSFPVMDPGLGGVGMLGARRSCLAPSDSSLGKVLLEDVGNEYEKFGSDERTRHPVAAPVLRRLIGIEIVRQLSELPRDHGRFHKRQRQAVHAGDGVGDDL
jgi:hypothetical protein